MNCGAFAQAALGFLKSNHFSRIVIVSAWPVYFQGGDGAYLISEFCLREKDACRKATSAPDFEALADLGFQRLAAMIGDLRNDGAEIAVVGVNLLTSSTATSLAQMTFTSGQDVVLPPIDRGRFEQAHSLVVTGVQRAAGQGGAVFVNPLASLCDSKLCPLYRDEHFLFRDGNHVRASIIRSDTYDFLDTALRSATK